MICHRDGIIFVHLRRTAGNSIEVALGGVRLFDRFFRPTDTWDNRLHRGRSWRKLDLRGHRIHATASEIRSLYPRQFDRFFRFTFVRNPWTQLASLYTRLHANDPGYEGFRSWLWRFALARGTVPNASLYDADGRCLVDFVGRFERLQQDFDEVCDRAGINRRRLPLTNTAASVTMDTIYDDASRRLVERLYGPDIERFGYQFDGTAATSAGPYRQAA